MPHRSAPGPPRPPGVGDRSADSALGRPDVPAEVRAASPRTGFDWSMDRRMVIAIAGLAGLVALFTFVLQPYDTFNLGLFLYDGSYLALGQTPYSVLAIPPPPNLLILPLGAFLAYAASGFNLEAAVGFFKGANAVFLVLTALVTSNLVGLSTGSRLVRSRVFSSLVLSFPLFFYSFIHVQLDIFGMFWAILGIYLYYVPSPNESSGILRRVSAGVILGYATYSYVIPVIFLPTMVVFERRWRDRVILVVSYALGTLLFALSYLLTGVYSPTSPIGGSPGPNSPFSLPFVLGNFPSASLTPVFLGIWLVSAALLPVLLRRLRADVPTSFFVALTAFVMLLPIYNGDNFVWIVPWLAWTLAVHSKRLPVSWWTLIGSGLILLPEIVVFNFWDGLIGMGTGIYYLFYPQFGNPYVIWEHVPYALHLSQLLMALTFAGMLWVCIYSARASRVRTSTVGGGELPASTSRKEPAPGVPSRARRPSTLVGRTLFQRRALTPFLAVIALLVLLVLGVAQPALSAGIGGTAPEFPFGVFLVHPPVNANLTYSLTDGGRTVVLPATVPAFDTPIAFLRNASAETFSASLSLGVEAPAGAVYNTTVLATQNLSVDLVARPVVPLGPSILPVSGSQNVPPGTSMQPPEWQGSPLPVYSVSGTGLQSYALANDPSLLDAFFFHLSSLPFPQNVVWSLSTGAATAELTAARVGAHDVGYGLAYTTAPDEWLGTPNAVVSSLYWNVVELAPQGTSVTVLLNGVPLGIVPARSASLALNLGRFSGQAQTMNAAAFDGEATAAFSTPAPLPADLGVVVEVNGVYQPMISPWNGALSFTASGSSTTLRIGASLWSAESAYPVFQLGRMSTSSVTILLTVSEFTLESSSDRSILPVFLWLTVATPVLFSLMPTLGGWVRRRPARAGDLPAGHSISGPVPEERRS